MRQVLTIAAIAAVVLVAAAPAGASSTKGPTLKSLAAQVKALQKQVTTLKKRAATDEKHEYYQGQIFAMSGCSREHNEIFSNLFSDIGSKLKGKGCKPYGSDFCTHVQKNTLYTYPDIFIVCGEPELTDHYFDTVTNPSVIIEILSKTARRGEPFLCRCAPTPTSGASDSVSGNRSSIWTNHQGSGHEETPRHNRPRRMPAHRAGR